MGSLSIVQKDAPCDEIIDWPLLYMNDFSVLGLVVDNAAIVSALLKADGYHVDQRVCSTVVHFENNGRYKNILYLLQQHRIDFTLSDLAGCAYQG
jgi:hypothetical protein